MSENVKGYISDIKELMIEWDYENNDGLDPSSISLGSGKRIWWICQKCGGVILLKYIIGLKEKNVPIVLEEKF